MNHNREKSMNQNNETQQEETTEKPQNAEIVKVLKGFVEEHLDRLEWFLFDERENLKEGLCEAVTEYGLDNVTAAASHPNTNLELYEQFGTNLNLGNLLVEMYITLDTDRPDLRQLNKSRAS